ncbi:MAG TPA: antitermination regulator, partial [Kribbella sp.]|nr:antitermination regulator [Kribbella sp.]
MSLDGPPRENTASTFAALALELHDAPGVEETVDAVVQFALQALNCTYAGVAFSARGARPEVAAVTAPVVAGIYELQITTKDGPLV